MESIEIKNFFLIIFGKNKNIKKELEFIVDGEINSAENENIFMATFQSTLFAKDIEILLSEFKFKFIVCEVIPSLFSADLGNLNKTLFITPTPKNCNMMYENFEEISNKIDNDLSLDELLDLISKKGIDYLTEKQKEKLNHYSNNI